MRPLTAPCSAARCLFPHRPAAAASQQPPGESACLLLSGSSGSLARAVTVAVPSFAASQQWRWRVCLFFFSFFFSFAVILRWHQKKDLQLRRLYIHPTPALALAIFALQLLASACIYRPVPAAGPRMPVSLCPAQSRSRSRRSRRPLRPVSSSWPAIAIPISTTPPTSRCNR